MGRKLVEYPEALQKKFAGMFFGIKDQDLFARSLRGILQAIHQVTCGYFFADNLITYERNLTFLWDAAFEKAMADNALDDVDRSTVWRKAVHYWAAQHCSHLPGDFVECGVWRGSTVAILCQALNFGQIDKTWWLYDIFDHKEGDLHEKLKGMDGKLYDYVRDRLQKYPNVRLVKGYVPESFNQGLPERISLLYIDMNNAAAEMGALEAMWDRVVPGGIVLLDDYGWIAYSAQTMAEREFFAQRGYSVLELPTGQGLVLKR